MTVLPPSLFEDQFRFVVEPTKVREFASATWDGNRRFCSGDVDQHDGPSVPLTFIGAASTMMGRPHLAQSVAFDVTRGMHGEERMRYHRPIAGGDHLDAAVTARETSPVIGRRGGRMRRVAVDTVFTDPVTGEVVADVTRTLLEPEHVVAGTPSPSDLGLRTCDDGIAAPVDPLDRDPVDPWTLHVGARSPLLRVGPLTRTDFVRYAMASGDLTSVHFDEVVAVNSGYPAPFAMGMLTGGFVGHLFNDWLAVPRSFELTVRFVTPVFPGDVVELDGSIEKATAETVMAAATGRTDRGVVVTARLVVAADEGSL